MDLINESYISWESFCPFMLEKTNIHFEYGKCHPKHYGLSINGKLPFSISEYEFNFMRDFIINHNLKNAYELATGIGISSIGIGLGLKKTGGKLVTIDSYDEEDVQEQPNVIRLNTSKDIALERNKKMFLDLGLDNIKPFKYYSPDCIEVLKQEFQNNIDFVFLDCPKTTEAFIRDITFLPELLNKEKFAIFVHDTHCFTESFISLSKQLFDIDAKFIHQFKSKNSFINQTFPLAIITNIEI